MEWPVSQGGAAASHWSLQLAPPPAVCEGPVLRERSQSGSALGAERGLRCAWASENHRTPETHSDPSDTRVPFEALPRAVGSVRGVGNTGRRPFRPCQMLWRKADLVVNGVQTRFYFILFFFSPKQRYPLSSVL